MQPGVKTQLLNYETLIETPKGLLKLLALTMIKDTQNNPLVESLEISLAL